MCMYISCVGLCVHGFMNPLPSWFVYVFCFVFFSDVLTYCVMLQAFICYWSSSDVYDVRACARACVFHWHCSAQLSMFNMEKRYRNKIIIIIIIITWCTHLKHAVSVSTMGGVGPATDDHVAPEAVKAWAEVVLDQLLVHLHTAQWSWYFVIHHGHGISLSIMVMAFRYPSCLLTEAYCTGTI